MAQQWPPKRATAFTFVFPIRGGDGQPVTGVAGLDSERSIDGAAFADCTNEATEIGTTGFYSLTLTAAEMTGDYITIQVKSTSYPTQGFFITTTTSTWNELDARIPSALVSGRIDASVGAMAAGVVTAAAVATDAIDADALAADAVAEIADGVWDEDATAHQTGGTFGQAIGDPGADANTIYAAVVTNAAGATIAADIIAVQADTDDIQTRLPAALVGGKMDSDVTAISGDTAAADNLEKEYDGTGYGHILQRTTIATLASQTSFTLTAGSADNNAYNGCIMVIEDASTAAQKAVAVISAYTGLTKTITLLNDPAIFTMAVGDTVTVIADRAVKPTVDNRTLDVAAGGEAGVDFDNITGTLDAAEIGAGAITASTFAAGAINAAATAADFLAEINAEVVDVMNTDTTSLPGQGAPPLAPTLREMVAWLYKVLRNRTTQTATQWSLYADDETTIDAKATVSDDGTTATKQEVVTGP